MDLRLKRIKLGISILLIILLSSSSHATETDQITIPKIPLADIGPEIDQKVRSVIEDVIREFPTASLDFLAFQVYKSLGTAKLPQFIYSQLEYWIRHHSFSSQPERDHPVADETIFSKAKNGNLKKKVTLGILADTINIFGVNMGEDKLGHFFQFGSFYFTIYRKMMSLGFPEWFANYCMIHFGIFTENGIFGKWLTGIVSEADLAANYLGFKFYLNLTESVTKGSEEIPPILTRVNGHWELDPNREFILRPFISNILNEAWNVPLLRQDISMDIFEQVKLRCKSWKDANPGISSDSFEKAARELRTWDGEDYGNRISDQLPAASGLPQILSLGVICGSEWDRQP